MCTKWKCMCNLIGERQLVIPIRVVLGWFCKIRRNYCTESGSSILVRVVWQGAAALQVPVLWFPTLSLTQKCKSQHTKRVGNSAISIPKREKCLPLSWMIRRFPWYSGSSRGSIWHCLPKNRARCANGSSLLYSGIRFVWRVALELPDSCANGVKYVCKSHT